MLFAVSITVYVLFAMEYFWRYFSDKPLSHKAALAEDETRSAPDKGVKIMMAALSFDTLCIFIRAVYRTIELANGWTGHVIETQVYFSASRSTSSAFLCAANRDFVRQTHAMAL